MFIGGDWVKPSTDRVITPIDASTEQPLGSVPDAAEADVDSAVAAARAAFDAPNGWSRWEPARRAEIMLRLADAIDARAEESVARVSAQNGMPVAVARQLEIGYPSAELRYYAGLAEDLSLTETREGLFGSTLLNNGQTCFLGTRVPAPRSRYDEVVDAFTALAGSLTVGAAADPTTRIGPMATARQRERVETYIARGRSEGARITVGGGRPAHLDRGWFVEPTVFADVDNSAVVARRQPLHPRSRRPLRRSQGQWPGP